MGVAESADGIEAELASSERLTSLPSRLLSQTAIHTDRLVTKGLAVLGARRWDYAVLVTLRDFGSKSQAELSRQTGIYRSDMVSLITELSGRGYVQRAPDPADQRRNLITLTSSGRRFLRQLDDVVDQLQDEILLPLSDHERAQLTALLRRVLDHLAKGSPPVMRATRKRVDGL